MRLSVLVAAVALFVAVPAAAQSEFDKNLEKLKRSSCWEKAEAAQELGRLKDPRAVPALKEALKDEFTSVQVAAAKALLEFNDSTGLDMFMAKLVSKDCKELLDAVGAVSQVGGKKTAPKIAELLAHEDVTVRETAANTLAGMGEGSICGKLIEGLKDKERRVRRACAYALGELKYKEAAGPLIELLGKDKAPEVRLRCAEALGAMQAKDAVQALGARLSDTEVARNFPEAPDGKIVIDGLHVFHREEPVALAAVRALGAIGSKGAVGVLIECVKAKDPLSLEAAVYFLGRLGDNRAIEPIKALVKPGDRAPEYVLMALALLGDASVKEDIVRMYVNPSEGSDAYETSGKLRYVIEELGIQEEVFKAALEILRNPNANEREKQRAMRRLMSDEQTKRALPELLALLKEGPEKMRKYVAEHIRDIRDDKVAPALMEYAAKQKDDELRGALYDVGYTCDKRATDFLINYFTHPNHDVREAAVCGMSEIKDPKAIPALKKVLETDKWEGVRHRAATAIADSADENTILLVESIFRTNKEDKVKSVMFSALLRLIRHEKAWRAILRLLEDKEPVVNWPRMLAWLRPYTGFKQALPYLVPLTAADMPTQVRLWAIEALAEIGGAAVAKTIVPLLDDEDMEVAGRAAGALAKLKNKKGIDVLIRIAGDQKIPFRVRDRLLCVVRDCEVTEAADLLVKLLEDPEPDIRSGACCVLGIAGMEKGREPLWKILKDESKGELRYDAAYGLARLGDKEVIPYLAEFEHAYSDPHTKYITRKYRYILLGKSMEEFYRSLVDDVKSEDWFEVFHRGWRIDYRERIGFLEVLAENHPAICIRGMARSFLRSDSETVARGDKYRKELAETNKYLEEASRKKDE